MSYVGLTSISTWYSNVKRDIATRRDRFKALPPPFMQIFHFFLLSWKLCGIREKTICALKIKYDNTYKCRE